MEDKIEYVGNRSELPPGFAMIIPKGLYVPPKEPWFKVWNEYNYWHLKIKMPGYPKWLDKLLKPLCKYGLHRWVGTFGFCQYSWSADTRPGSFEVKREHNFRCARCKKNKSIPATDH